MVLSLVLSFYKDLKNKLITPNSNTYPNTTINVPDNNSSNWTYNNSVNSYGFYTTINIPQNAYTWFI